MTYKYTEGDPNAKICLVGEAPGVDEVRTGRPFVGKVGRLFTSLLTSAGISRSDCYITNVIKERPLNNDPVEFIKITQSRVSYTSPKFDEYVQILKDQLSNCQANVIVAIGNIALHALTGVEKPMISKRRGSIYNSTLLPGRKVIGIIHPGVIRRQYLARFAIKRDLQRIKEESKTPDINLPMREFIIKPSLHDTLAFIDRAHGSKLISFDIEIIRGGIDCLAIALDPLYAISIPFMAKGSNYFSPSQEVEVWEAIAELFNNQKIAKVGHNTAFDATLLYRTYGILATCMEDTMIARKLVRPDLLKRLEVCTADYTKEPYYKDEGERWKGEYVSDEDFWMYNAKDAAVTYEIARPLAKELKRQKNTATYRRQKGILRPLIYMMVRGIRMDTVGLKREYDDHLRQIKEMQKELDAIVGHEINFDSPKQVRSYFYIELGIKPLTHKGKVTVDETAMKRLAAKGYKAASIIQDVRSLRTISSTFLDVKLDDDNRLRCSFDPGGAATGRLSSSKRIDTGTGMNQQNQPPIVKNFMLADEGYILYELDKAQAENRIVANCAPEPTMKHTFDSGIDIHCQTFSLMFGIPIEQVSRKKGSCTLGTGKHSQRDWGKKANHSLNYDLGWNQFMLTYECSAKEAKLLIARYHAVYPGIRAHYHAWIQNQLRKDRTITNCSPFERKRLFLGPMERETYKKAYSHFPQSTVGDLINDYGLIYMDECYDYLPVQLLNQVHDSVVIQIPLTLSWTRHGELLLQLINKLDTPLTFRGTSFIIPTGLKGGLRLGKAEETNHTGKSAEDLGIDLKHIHERALLYEEETIKQLQGGGH